MKRHDIHIVALMLVLLLTGCATVMRSGLKEDCGTVVYPASQADLGMIASAFTHHYCYLEIPTDSRVLHYIFWCPVNIVFGAIDMPISLVTDTICLPYDLRVRDKGEANQASDAIGAEAAPQHQR